MIICIDQVIMRHKKVNRADASMIAAMGCLAPLDTLAVPTWTAVLVHLLISDFPRCFSSPGPVAATKSLLSLDADVHFFEEVRDTLAAAQKVRKLRSSEATRLVATEKFTPNWMGSHVVGTWNRTRHSAGRFFALANRGHKHRRFPDARGRHGGRIQDGIAQSSALQEEHTVDLEPHVFFEAAASGHPPPGLPLDAVYSYHTAPLQQLAPG
eukprot:SAG11_NODE_11313_length_769_cov_0.914925_1_plen_210_part_10